MPSQVADEDDVYDDLDEDAYQELVKKRREDNFIEDDDGNGAWLHCHAHIGAARR